MSETRVVHVNDNIEGAVYIGRAMPHQGLKASTWANPWKVSKDLDRKEAVHHFYRDLMGTNRSMLATLPELRGKALACWCRHDGHDFGNECHGDILVGLLDAFTDTELIELAAEKVAICRECGCSDDVSCDGGCYWIEPDLCSACLGVARR